MISLPSIVKSNMLFEQGKKNTERALDRTSGDINERREYIIRQAIRKAQHIENDAVKRSTSLVECAYEKSYEIITEAEKKGYENGYAQGLKEGATLAENQAQEGLDELKDLIELIKRQQEELLEREEKNLLLIALEMTKKIIKQSAKVDEAFMPNMLEDIIKENEGTIKIYLSEYNKALDLNMDKNIVEKIRNLSKNTKVVLVTQEDMIMAETENGMVDMSITEQLKKLKNACLED